MKPNARLFLSIFAVLLMVLTGSWLMMDNKAVAEPDPEAPAGSVNQMVVIDDPILDDNTQKNEILMKLIYEGLSQVHYQPLNVNNDFSEKAYDLYLKRIDFNKRFLTAADVDELNKWRTKIDDEILNLSYEFFELAYQKQVDREAQFKGWYEELLAEPFDFNKNETVVYDGENIAWAADEAELKERWRKVLKYETLTRLVDAIEAQEKPAKDGEEPAEVKSMAQLEKEARGKVKKNYDDWFERLSKFDMDDRRSVYINAIANVYGPHTEYFPPVDRENFDIAMSGKLEGIGARLMEKEGYIRVTEIVPGSASALQGELEAEDIVMEVTQEGEEEAVSIVGAKIDDAVKLIRGPKDSKVTLTVKKPDGEIRDIMITRDVVIIEETYAKSAILEKDGKRYGVLDLPKFYADFSGSGGRSCADDVKKELAKLNDEKVDGIIFDLRGNGGGSLADAVKMSGLFIEAGPIVQVKSKDAAPKVLSDRDAAVQYDGKMVILVDHFSASASEILAAAMQDYERAVVIGSSSSFGKGTVQQFLELDRFVGPDAAALGPLGSLKITLQKFYRINGGATQLKGVTPDIILPDSYLYLDMGERDQEHVMQWDQIEPADYDVWSKSVKVDKLRRQSEARVQASPTFTLIEENARRMKRQSDRNSFTLNLEDFRAQKTEWDAEAKKYKSIRQPIDGLEVEAPEEDQASIDADEKKKDRIDNWHKQLTKDPYLEEAMHVLDDMK